MNHILDETDRNLPELAACVDVETSVSKGQVTQSSNATKRASKRKRSIACSAIEVSVQCEPQMVDNRSLALINTDHPRDAFM